MNGRLRFGWPCVLVVSLGVSGCSDEVPVEEVPELTVTIVSPEIRMPISGQELVLVRAEPEEEVLGVEFSVDRDGIDSRYDVDLTPPFESVLDTRDLPDGPRELRVTAVGRHGQTAGASVVVLMDNVLPSLEVIAPVPGEVGFVEDGTARFTVRAWDGSGIERLTLSVDDRELTDVTTLEGDVYEGTIDLSAYTDEVGSSLVELGLWALAEDAFGRQSAVAATLTVARRLRWRAVVPAAVAGASAPSPDGRISYIATIQGVVHALDTETGAEICRSSQGPEIYRGPTVSTDGAAVYVGTASGMRAITAAPTCSDLWTARAGEVAQGTPQVHPSNRVIYFTTREGGLHAASPDGEVLWTRADVGLVRSGPTLVPELGLVVVASDDNFLHAVALDGAGNPLDGFFWSAETGAPLEASAALDHHRIYVGSTDFNVYAFDVFDGTRIWDAPFATGRQITTTPFIDGARDVYVTSRDGSCYKLTPERTLVWSYEVPSGIDYSGPVVDEAAGLVFFGETGATGADGMMHGILHALSRETGEAVWTATLDGSLSATPTLIDGTVIVGASSGLVYSFFIDDAAALATLGD
jgi:outer membrane protein assembly factor BamB